MNKSLERAMTQCLVCREQGTRKLLDFGPQALCNRFLIRPEDSEFLHPTVLGQCGSCGTVQLVAPAPAEQLVAPFDWIRYNEAEGHLDSLAQTIASLPNLPSAPRVLAVSYKDETLLKRLQERGFEIVVLDPANDLGIENSCAGIETLQSQLTAAQSRQVAERLGSFDIILVRHVLEHAHAPLEFMQAMRMLAGPNGFVVFEVPDCTKALEDCDYTTIWDEHTLYLTPVTFRAALVQGGFELVHFEVFPYSNENCLAAIAKPARSTISQNFCSREDLNREISRATRFAESFDGQRAWWQSFCTQYRREKGEIALLGAGHLACTFVNLMGLHKDISFVADDHPRKRGLFMPGSKLQIIESAALVERNVSLCLTIMSAESEQRVMQRQQVFLDRGGTLGSVCPGSRLSVQRQGLLEPNSTDAVPNQSAPQRHQAGSACEPQGDILKTRAVSQEVLFADQSFVELGRREITMLKDRAPLNSRPRMRICTHLDDQCLLHEMIIAFSREAYIRPHKHTHKLVSHHIIEGRADIVYFDDAGEITRVVSMGDYRSGLKFYSRASEHHYYMLIIRSESLVVHESTQGPFFREGTLFPDWSPPETDKEAARRFITETSRRVDAFLTAQNSAVDVAAAA